MTGVFSYGHTIIVAIVKSMDRNNAGMVRPTSDFQWIENSPGSIDRFRHLTVEP